MNESQTRLNLIDPALRAAGSTEENDAQILVDQSAVEFAPGKVGVGERRSAVAVVETLCYNSGNI